MMFHLPWPKGAPAPAVLFDRKPANWDVELAVLRATTERFVPRDVNGPWPTHLAFGRISGSAGDA